ncbi:hypothetical protein K7432_013436 [Basidiobolus ranarum]|uniref:Uncharacterized protein n=1 Tax=Basidiobolus ranarum TaxID=34480 RepID=A0ABR2WJ99_9FUNG
MRLSVTFAACLFLTSSLVCQVFGAAVTSEEEACESGLSKCSDDDPAQFFDCAEGQWIDRVCAPGSICVLEGEMPTCKLLGILNNLANGAEIQEEAADQLTDQEGITEPNSLEELDSDEDAGDGMEDTTEEESVMSDPEVGSEDQFVETGDGDNVSSE